MPALLFDGIWGFVYGLFADEEELVTVCLWGVYGRLGC
jgi:hypothetical protein